MPTEKCRSWWWVQLIESLPETWETDLNNLCVPSAYIIHDKDFSADTGELVKPHVHCLMQFPNAVRPNTIFSVLPESFGVKHTERVASVSGACRYMLHIEQEGKYEYSLDDLHIIHGLRVNLSDTFSVTFKDLYVLIRDYGITCFSQLVSYCVEVEPRYLDYVLSHNVLLRGYFNDLNIQRAGERLT